MHSPRQVITLTTDFGVDGPYVAALKGVILGLAPDAHVIDVSHRVAPQNVLEGAFIVCSIIDAYPRGTVHLAVVDPGVGTERALVALRVADQWVIAPDNGLPGALLVDRSDQGIWTITNPALRRSRVSNTFHGRDILAPAACHVATGGDPALLGPRRQSLNQLRNLQASETRLGYVGEVIYRDTFGNLITNIRESRLSGAPDSAWEVEIAGYRVRGISKTYGDRPHGSLVALVGSSGWLELAVVNGDAGRNLGASLGTTVLVTDTRRSVGPMLEARASAG
jgi:hypothetical protein